MPVTVSWLAPEQIVCRYDNRSVAYLFTRQQLYEFVWADPIITQAKKSLRVSDVELAKACRRGGIPLPPRGDAVAFVLAGERRYARPDGPRSGLDPGNGTRGIDQREIHRQQRP